MEKKSMVIFDLDGTLIDSRRDLATGVNLMRAHYKLPALDLETVSTYIGNGARKLAERAVAGNDICVDDAFNLMRNFYTEHMFEQTSLYPGVLEGLKMIKEKKYYTSIVTNKPDDSCKAILDHLNLSEYFDVILGASDRYMLKPEPEMLFAVMNETNSIPESSWMVGDNYTDMESGERAGVKTCFVTYGFGKLKQCNFDLSVNSLPELAAFL
jgi:2-phosphoglycolate phosphatase